MDSVVIDAPPETPPLTSWSELVLIGLSHKEAGVSMRERLALPPAELTQAAIGLREAGRVPGLIALPTCNRLELYASTIRCEATEDILRGFFAQRCPGSEALVFARRGRGAVQHLFRLASGLESVVVGEHQILSQVKSAYQAAAKARLTDKLLNKLFQAALAAGKDIRSKTGICQGLTSCGGAAVAMAEKILAGKGRQRILLVGAGKMAETAAQHLVSHKTAELFIANRDMERARALAAQHGAQALSLEQGMAAIREMDVVIASTACPHYLVTKERLAGLAADRKNRPLVVIDLGMPRNVDPAAASIAGVHLHSVDDLEAVVQESLAKRRGEIEAAEKIAAALTDEFCALLAGEPAPI